MNFKIDGEFKELMELHVSQGCDNYDLMCESEWAVIKGDFGNPRKVLDLGCGLGRMSIYINNTLGDDGVKWILADSTSDFAQHKSLRFGWNPPAQYYNNLQWTEQFSINNGLVNFEIFDIAKSDLGMLEDVDLVMSFLSVGFHYPIERYLETLLRITNASCTLIFGVRKGVYKKKMFKKYFSSVSIRPQDGRIYTKEDILILKGRK